MKTCVRPPRHDLGVVVGSTEFAGDDGEGLYVRQPGASVTGPHQRHDLMTTSDQRAGSMAADETSSAGQEDFHG